MKIQVAGIITYLAILTACKASNFAADGGAAQSQMPPNSNGQGPGANGGPPASYPSTNNGQPSGPGGPGSAGSPGDGALGGDNGASNAGLIQTDLGTIAPVDLPACTNAASRGLLSYSRPGTFCPANSVVVIINDGTAKEMTCCPLGATGVLSANANELNQRRTGSCAPDEVATGMEDAVGPVLYCSKIDTSRFVISPTTKVSIYAKERNATLTAEMRVLMGEYNINDACICPENMIILGGHTSRDNQCTDRCGAIVKK